MSNRASRPIPEAISAPIALDTTAAKTDYFVACKEQLQSAVDLTAEDGPPMINGEPLSEIDQMVKQLPQYTPKAREMINTVLKALHSTGPAAMNDVGRLGDATEEVNSTAAGSFVRRS